MEPNDLPDRISEPADVAAEATPARPGTTASTFHAFRQGVLDVLEQGEEIVVTTRVWTVEEVVFRRRVSERLVVVRDTVRTVDVDVDRYPAIARTPDPHAN